jgi:hypothetical protein
MSGRGWWLLACAGLVNVAAAQTTPPCPPPLAYEQWTADTHPVRALSIDGPRGGRLTYLPAEHSRDPAHPQLAGIERAWNDLHPTLAFYEGPNRPIADSAEATVRQAGESGFVRFLAQRDGVKLARLEPPPQDEAASVRERFGAERTELFYLLREAAQQRERRGASPEALKASMAQLIPRLAALPGMQPVIRSVDDLQAAYARHWTSPANWWEAPMAWFDPLKDGKDTGGVFTNDVNRASSAFRNVHMVRVLSQAVRDGQRVIAVVGGNHVPLQEAALRCEIAR